MLKVCDVNGNVPGTEWPQFNDNTNTNTNTPSKSKIPQAANEYFLGCFKFKPNPSDLEGDMPYQVQGSKIPNGLSVEICQSQCAEYKFNFSATYNGYVEKCFLK